MKNVYKIRYEEEGNRIFSLYEHANKKIEQHKAAIIIHMHYEESINKYERYITDVPREIDVFITSSSEEVLKKIKNQWQGFSNITIIKKENRGRDISSFLVACRSQLQKYDYFCFVHDKHANRTRFKEDVELWNRNLWENTIGSSHYIYNILSYFEKDRSCGLLIPPEPIGEGISAWYHSAWYKDYECTRKLVEKIGLCTDIDEDFPPISIGTVFWAQGKALKKLICRDWRYEDFPNEPMPQDGTISHAIERILPYVCQDAGYKTYTCMSSDYSVTLMARSQYYFNCMSETAGKYLGLYSMNSILYMKKLEKKIGKYFEKYKSVYLYGAGLGGRQCLLFLLMNNCVPSGFIVSESINEKYICGYPVYLYEDIRDRLVNAGIIISVLEDTYKKEISDRLKTDKLNTFLLWKEIVE